MKILLLGATGRTGRLVLQSAIRKGYQVNCLARNVHRIPTHESVQVFEGNAANPNDLESAIDGCTTVISVLSISRKSDFPWSSLKTPATYLSVVMNILAPLAKTKGISRLVVCSAWGVSETKQDIPGWFRWLIDNSNIGVAYRDHERQEVLIQESQLCFTIIRPAGLTNSKNKQVVRETFSNVPKPSLTISRQTLADYLVDCSARPELSNKIVTVSKD